MRYLARALAMLVLGLCLSVSVAFAQNETVETAVEDFDRWAPLAREAEEAIDEDRGTDATLEAMRSRIAEYRSEFEAASSLNAASIQTVRQQIAALGPAPEGEAAEAETPDVAAQREELNSELSQLLVPVQRAEAEFVRANSLIGQIDTMLRERQTAELLTVTPSPLNPAYWSPAVEDFVTSFNTLWAGASVRTGNWAGVRQNLPVVIGLTVLGLVLIFRGRAWAGKIVRSLQRFGARGFGIWRFVVSLLRIALPFAGLVLFALAFISTGMLTEEGNAALLTLAILGGMMLGVRWVSERVFARDDDEALILLEPEKRKELRFHVGIITVMIVIAALVDRVLEAGTPALVSESVLVFPALVVSALMLYRIGVILRGYTDPPVEGDTALAEARSSTLARVVRGFGLGAVIVGVVSPLLLAAGYYSAADALLPPYIMTLVVLGLVMSLQRFTADVFGAVTGQGEQARDALMPVLFGMILLLLALPVLALIWGARVTDLTELWAAFSRGFSIGDSRISPTDFVTFAIIFVVGYILTRLVQSALRSNVLPKTKIDIGGQNAIVSGLGYIGIFLAAMAAITGAGIDLSSLALVASALSVGIGFGLQTIVSNFVSGIILLIERPISEGDWIEVGGQMGYVRDISVRSTRIETFDRTDVIVPNADLVAGTVTNYTRGNTLGRVIVPVGVAYSYAKDTKRISDILLEIINDQPMVVANPAPNVLFVNFGADALQFEIRAFLRDVNWIMLVKSDVNHAIAKRFAEEGIEIPFAQRDMWLRNPEALQTGARVGTTPQADQERAQDSIRRDDNDRPRRDDFEDQSGPEDASQGDVPR